MKRLMTIQLALLLALGAKAGLAALGAEAPDKPQAAKAESKNQTAAVKETTIVIKPKPLSLHVKKGLAYLVSQQRENGGWGQGGGWRMGPQSGRVEGEEVKDPPDLADTCIATLALVRAGHTPQHGEFAKNVAKAMEFICNHIEKADKESLYVTDIRDTQLQSKLGPYVDTFLASWVLAEMKDSMPNEKDEKRLAAALDKVIAKVERHQRKDGTWTHEGGWAPILCQALACKGLNRARQVGCKVTDTTLARAEKYATANFDQMTGTFGAPGLGGGGFGGGAGFGGGGSFGGLGGGGLGLGGLGSTGVPLYTQGGQLGGLQSSIDTNRQMKDTVRQIAKSKTAPKEEKVKAQDQLRRFEEAEKVQEKAAHAILKQLEDKEFIKGVGSNGGEEFLSYMNISDILVAKGGKEWQKWDKKIADNLDGIQNKDGSWAGQHCITGRTFCTASALLVLLADRAPVPVAAKAK